MTSTAVLLATLLAVPSIPSETFVTAEAEEEEPGAPKVVQREKQRWLPNAEEDEQLEAASRSKVAPAVVMGLSVVAGIAGTVFLMKTVDALDRADSTLGIGLGSEANSQTVPTINPRELRDQQRDVLTNGIATTTLLSASIAGLVTSTVLLISD